MDKQTLLKKIAISGTDTQANPPQPIDWDISMVRTKEQPKTTSRNKLWKIFSDRFQGINGITCEEPSSLIQLLKEKGATQGYLDPELQSSDLASSVGSEIALSDTFNVKYIDAYAFGITRAAGIIAETGTIILKEESTPSRLAALAPCIHIAVVDADTPIYATLLQAVEAFGNDPYIVFATGPSKTADVEGILIEGVHGPGIQVCYRL